MGKIYDSSMFLMLGMFDIFDLGFVEELFGVFVVARGCLVYQMLVCSGATLVMGYDVIVEVAVNVFVFMLSFGVVVFLVEERDCVQGSRSIIVIDLFEYMLIWWIILFTFLLQKVRDEYEPITKALCEQYVVEFGD